MKKTLLITALLVLSSTVALADYRRPVTYSTCIGGYLFAVAYTPDGDSSNLQLVQILAYGPGAGAPKPIKCK